MTIHSGRVSLSRYRLVGPTQRTDLSTLNSLLEPHKAEPIRLDGIHKEEVASWVRPLGLDEVDLPEGSHWDLSDCRLEDGFLLRMRMEKRKVPAALLQAELRRLLDEQREKTGKTPSRKEKRDLKDELQRKLTGKALPNLSFTDVFWREPKAEILVFSGSKAVRKHFEALFRATFADPLGLALISLEPPLTGLGSHVATPSKEADETIGRLSAATPSLSVIQGGGA